MPTHPRKSISISTDWMMEVYDWVAEFPEDKSGGLSAIGSDLSAFSTPGDVEAYAFMNYDLLSAVQSQTGSAGLRSVIQPFDESNTNKGLVSLNYSRGKGRVDNQCTAIVVGPLPKCVRSGNWVIVRSVERKSGDDVVAMVRFVGQILTISSSINVLESGAIVQQNTISISEWSHLLLSPVTFDLRRGYSMQAVQAGIAGLSETTAKDDPNSIVAYINLQRNPYTACKAALALIGFINKGATTTKDLNIYTVCMTMPWLPKAFLDAMDCDSEVDPQNPFATGFAKIIAGRCNGPAFNKNWDGFFTAGNEISSIPGLPESVSIPPPTSIKDYIKFHADYADNVILQATSASGMVMSQLGNTSAWTILERTCDPQYNEIYTDMLYEKDGSSVRAYPVVVIRGKPWRTQAAEKVANIEPLTQPAIYKTWPKFDDLPRISLDSTLMMSISFTNTVTTSPTYFHLGFDGSHFDALNRATAQFSAWLQARNSAEMYRFGGSEQCMDTNYWYDGTDMQDWAKTRITLGKVWYGYNYRTANGHLRIKDPGIPLSIGMNIQFTINDSTLVAQVDSISVDFAVEQTGVKQTVTTIGFSRLMGVRINPGDPDDNSLFFMPQSFFSNPYAPIAKKSEFLPTSFGNLA